MSGADLSEVYANRGKADGAYQRDLAGQVERVPAGHPDGACLGVQGASTARSGSVMLGADGVVLLVRCQGTRASIRAPGPHPQAAEPERERPSTGDAVPGSIERVDFR